MLSFNDLVQKNEIFKDMNVLSPHFVPEILPHREQEIETIMRTVAPALRNSKPKNMFLYGKTGTGKTCCSKHVMEKFNEMKKNAIMKYMNCRIYDSRYKVMFKIANEVCKGDAKIGYPLSKLYETILEWIEQNNMHLIFIMDEIDMVNDIDDLIYTMTRANDELDAGSLSLIGISNRLHFKEKLDPRSKSGLYETEVVFKPYNASQLYEIIKQRSEMAFNSDSLTEPAIRMASALAARETGDARYALKLILKAGMIANEKGSHVITEEHVELARKSVDEDLAAEAISTLPQHEQVALYGISLLYINGSRYKKFGDDDLGVFMSGEVYDSYVSVCKSLGITPRSSRWFSEYLHDLDMLGLITLTSSGKGTRGQTRFIKLTYDPHKIKSIIENMFS